MRSSSLTIALFALVLSSTLSAQSGTAAKTLVTQSINDSEYIRLAGNTRPEATPANDRGPVADSHVFKHMFLLLNRPADREAAIESYANELSDPSSPNYHHWLTAKQVGTEYGANSADVATVKNWLETQGFIVNLVYPTQDVIDFTGTTAQIRAAFHTQIHQLSVAGQPHLANMSDPAIPAALAPIVKGVVALNDFHPRPLYTKMQPIKPSYTTSSGYYLLAPADLATIYNLKPLFASNITGKGQTIVVLEDTDVLSPADWLAFRKRFALTKAYPYATFAQVNPQVGTAGNCDDPGVNGDDGEADLDIQWSSAAAPNGNIVLASCANTDTNFGPYIAMQNLLTSGARPPSIISLSYGGPETNQGAGFNAYINALYRLAVLEGVSMYVSSGDNDAAVADARDTPASNGINVNGLASTIYNVAVGGTDFSDSYFGENSTYWAPSNLANGGSAKSYVPEIPWNNSCGSYLIANVFGYANTYGANGFCNSSLASAYGYLDVVGGSGGPSACAYGTPNPPDSVIVSGTCAGYAKPSWQSLVGVPQDGVRDLPDVSLFAASGVWGHFYLFCYSDTTFGGVPCNEGLFGAGGTSFASPIVAGFQSLVNQSTGSSWGNPNPVLYALARAEYGTSGKASCNASLGNAVSSTCTFYDVTFGDNDAVCVAGTPNCYAPSGALGVLSTSTSSYKPAYSTNTGWDFSTGIGTINAANLVKNWMSGAQSVKH